MENTVTFLKSIKISSLTYHERVEIKNKGRPTPILNIEETGKSRNKDYVRKFNSSIYERHDWICGCEQSNSLFCFPCLLFGGESAWTMNGISKLKNLLPRIIKHQQSQEHLNNVVNLNFLGKVNIVKQLSEAHRHSVDRHNELVKRNRAVLSKIIDCILFCGKFELPLCDHDESDFSPKRGVFHGMIDFLCKSDPSLEFHFQTATAFKGTLKSIQNELLDSILVLCKRNIREEIEKTDFLAIMCDETLDIYGKSQMAIVFRYELKGKPVERFWSFFNPPNLTGEVLSEVILCELNTLLSNKEKLIAQTYDGAVSYIGKKGVQTRIKEVYKNAHYVHCYIHELNLIIEKIASRISSARVFFNSLSGIPAFFSKSLQRTAELEKITHQIPQVSVTKWNFNSGTVNSVYERKDELIECCSILQTSQLKETGLAAAGIKRMLSDSEFTFWLEFFSKIMPLVEMLFTQFQSRCIGATSAQSYVNKFIAAIEQIKLQYEHSYELNNSNGGNKKRKFSTFKELSFAIDVCDIIILECTNRFSFTGHLQSSKLLAKNCFESYLQDFPTVELDKACEAYPMLDRLKLKAELSVLYARDDIYSTDKLTDLLSVLLNNNLESAFSETVKLVRILITTPMISCEAERCFLTLKRIKKFLRNSMLNERLTDLAMLSIESKMISEINNFNEKVIDHFAMSRTQKIDFIFK